MAPLFSCGKRLSREQLSGHDQAVKEVDPYLDDEDFPYQIQKPCPQRIQRVIPFHLRTSIPAPYLRAVTS
jgi:hypothetical protein